MHTPKHLHKPPSEYSSLMVEVAKGCSHNRCLFCNLYPGGPGFNTVPFEHIVEDLEELAATERHPLRLVLVGGNVMGLPMDVLVPVLEAVREKLPTVREVSGYMRTSDIKLKSDEDLAELRRLGVTDVTIGTESGSDEALARMRKGQTAADVLEQYPRLEAAGIGYSLFYLGGFAGKGKCIEAARTSAEVYGQLHPLRITVMTMTPYPGCELRGQIERGEFELATESEVMLDVAEFIGGLDCDTVIVGSHDSNLFRIDGILPRDREGIVATLKMRAEQTNDKALGALRMRMLAM